jgi:zinc/manganese transport system substrate-binding protein
MNLKPAKSICNILIILILSLSVLTACGGNSAAPTADSGKPTIVVTYSVLGAVVSDLVGDQANVIVPIPNGQDPHDWEPSARDIETLTHADLIVQNGLHLEGGMEKALAQAQDAGVPIFIASDHITIRTVGAGEGIPSGDPDQAVGAQDPHLWMDPIAMKQVVVALAETLQNDLGLDVSARALDLENRLDELDTTVAAKVSSLPADQRKLVTGHESLGYFADRYDFKVIGAIIPSLSTQAEVSASELSALKSLIETQGVSAIFTELGTPPAVAEAIGQETGVKVVPISTHTLPADGSYFTFMTELCDAIVTALK